MLRTLIWIFIILLSVGVCSSISFGQGADQGSVNGRPDPSDPEPKSLKEMMTKMQIDEAKKQYNEMLDRSQQAVKLSEQVQHDFATKSQLTRDDMDKLNDLEKLVKKIRGELGGEDGGDTPDGENETVPTSPKDAISALGSITSRLADEVKKNTRFGISVAAIETSNAVLKLVRFLKFSN